MGVIASPALQEVLGEDRRERSFESTDHQRGRCTWCLMHLSGCTSGDSARGARLRWHGNRERPGGPMGLGMCGLAGG